jgi:hypothetical protein
MRHLGTKDIYGVFFTELKEFESSLWDGINHLLNGVEKAMAKIK